MDQGGCGLWWHWHAPYPKFLFQAWHGPLQPLQNFTRKIVGTELSSHRRLFVRDPKVCYFSSPASPPRTTHWMQSLNPSHWFLIRLDLTCWMRIKVAALITTVIYHFQISVRGMGAPVRPRAGNPKQIRWQIISQVSDFIPPWCVILSWNSCHAKDPLWSNWLDPFSHILLQYVCCMFS